MILRKIQTFRKLETGLRRMALEFVVLPLAIRAGFTITGVYRTTRLLSAWSCRRKDSRIVPDPARVILEALRLQQIVRTSLGLGGTCLMRSLVLKAVLRRRGVDTELRIGVRKQGTVAEGHAWLEFNGAPVNDAKALTETYVVFEGASMLDSWRSLI